MNVSSVSGSVVIGAKESIFKISTACVMRWQISICEARKQDRIYRKRQFDHLFIHMLTSYLGVIHTTKFVQGTSATPRLQNPKPNFLIRKIPDALDHLLSGQCSRKIIRDRQIIKPVKIIKKFKIIDCFLNQSVKSCVYIVENNRIHKRLVSFRTVNKRGFKEYIEER